MRNYLCLSLCVWLINLAAIAQDLPNAASANKWIYFSVRPGMSVDYVRTDGYRASNTEYKPSRRFMISAAIDVDNPEMKGVVVRLELTYRHQKFMGEGTEDNMGFIKNEFVFKTLTPEVSLLYKSPWKSKFRIYGGGGLGWNSRKIVKNETTMYYDSGPWVTQDLFPVKDQEWSFSLSAGVIYNSRLELCAKFFRSEGMGDSMLYEMFGKSKMIAVMYRF